MVKNNLIKDLEKYRNGQKLFPERLKAALDRAGKSMADLSRETNIPRARISEYMSGVYYPKQEAMMAIADALNVNEMYLRGTSSHIEVEKLYEGSERFGFLTESEARLLLLYKSMNDEGRKAALTYLEDIAFLPKYKGDEEDEITK